MKTIRDLYKSIDEEKKHLEFMPTGFKKIDKHLDGGFLRKELVVLGAPTGKGKSYIAGHIFNNIARLGFKSAYFSLEIANEMILSRILGEQSGISATHIMTGLVQGIELERLSEAKADLVAYNEFMYFYDDIYELTKFEEEIIKNKYDFVVIDFIQNVVTKGDEYERLSFISIALQRLAKKTNCTILILSQLSNLVAREKRDDIVEYRGSGAIATVCDLGFFVESTRTNDEDSNDLIIKLRKNRRGSSGIGFTFYFKNGKIIEPL